MYVVRIKNDYVQFLRDPNRIVLTTKEQATKFDTEERALQYKNKYRILSGLIIKS